MARNGSEWNDHVYRMTWPDQVQERLNGFCDYASGTGSASVTVAAPPAIIKGLPGGLALTDLHATGGAGAKVTVQSGSTTRIEFPIVNGVLTMRLQTPITTMPGEALVVSVAGGTGAASIAIVGHSVGKL